MPMEMIALQEQLQQLLVMQQQMMLLLEHIHGNAFNTDEWLDNNDLCRELKITERTLYRWRKQGFVKPVVIGGKCYYHKKMMERLEKG
ncbi:helix-turn-helix domain-containing protein [Pedobacter boryungensis]|uniref:Helix-turn-helix domain-containing protein n=1 Tax=Pedobacter boryungensis TaxID=869962 RepID=A0ABX2D9Q3_9SPHI|nr:helix-turn-helix domain-containing protein [Pedobacter boryungensis]NQX30577.1 helix-turn-helix domain-containing protein [Pedobacter boryungensis]